MDAGVVLLVFGLVFLSGSALAAFAWAVRDGQFEALDRAAESIFDADERADFHHGGHGGQGEGEEGTRG